MTRECLSRWVTPLAVEVEEQSNLRHFTINVIRVNRLLYGFDIWLHARLHSVFWHQFVHFISFYQNCSLQRNLQLKDLKPAPNLVHVPAKIFLASREDANNPLILIISSFLGELQLFNSNINSDASGHSVLL